MHLQYIHRARGVAIISIVAMHCLDNLDWSSNRPLYRFFVELFEGSTVVFFMISGYLFQHLSGNFAYTEYLKKKIKNVIVPYIVVSLPGIPLLLSKPYFLDQNPELIGTSWWQQVLFLYIYSGSQLNYVLWFVPVVTIYYLSAPLFIHFIKQPRYFLSLLVLIPVSILAHRTTIQKYHHLQLALYFLSAYMTGMWAALYRQKVLTLAVRYLAPLSMIVVAIIFGHLLLTDFVGSYVEEIFSDEQGRIDWIFVQKMLLFFVLIGGLEKLDALKMPAIDYVASVSFAIFFLHVYVLYVYSYLIRWHQYPGTVMSVVALLVVTVAFSTGLAYLFRSVFGSRSRLLIGA